MKFHHQNIFFFLFILINIGYSGLVLYKDHGCNNSFGTLFGLGCSRSSFYSYKGQEFESFEINESFGTGSITIFKDSKCLNYITSFKYEHRICYNTTSFSTTFYNSKCLRSE